jgi:hypothetical protein
MNYLLGFDPSQNITGTTAFGIGTVRFAPNLQLTQELTALSQVYEQYRVSRMEVYATLGKGFTADNKFKFKIFTRVDTGSSDITPVAANFYSMLSGQNCTQHTFERSGTVKIADVRPQTLGYGTPPSYTLMLPNSLQWLELNPSYFAQQLWRGVQIVSAIPDESYTPGELGISLSVAVTFQFRGRVVNERALTMPVIPASAQYLCPDPSSKKLEDDRSEPDPEAATDADASEL